MLIMKNTNLIMQCIYLPVISKTNAYLRTTDQSYKHSLKESKSSEISDFRNHPLIHTENNSLF